MAETFLGINHHFMRSLSTHEINTYAVEYVKALKNHEINESICLWLEVHRNVKTNITSISMVNHLAEMMVRNFYPSKVNKFKRLN